MDANNLERVWHGSHRFTKPAVWQSYLAVAIVGILTSFMLMVAVLP
ncbi:hypothetical protein ACQCSX_18710 [Pseudarthrobacter sp. P1]